MNGQHDVLSPKVPTRWILVPVTGALQAGAGFTANGVAPAGSVVAFKVADAGDHFVAAALVEAAASIQNVSG